jgi:endonuclease/exonuclease/phosphatase (EEP) superfamily protein YafD
MGNSTAGSAPSGKADPSSSWWRVARFTLYVVGALLLYTAAAPLYPANVWWVRVWDFPRLQLAAAYFAVAVAFAFYWRCGLPPRLLAGALVVAAAYQAWWIGPYLPVAPNELQTARSDAGGQRIRLMTANVLQNNRESEAFLRLVRDARPDVLVVVEVDDWWAERLAPLKQEFSHVTVYPLENGYGIAFYSDLRVKKAEVRFLVEPDIPSIDAVVEMSSGTDVRVFAVHPTPPMPGEDTEERDAELVLVGREVRAGEGPCVVLGDLNDVAWSATTRMFQRESRLLDPRKGRGMYSTFPVDYPPLRYPLDHLFVSDHFRLARLDVLADFGSDHFPLLAELSYEPGAKSAQEAPRRTAEGRKEADAALDDAGIGEGQAPR